MTRDEQEGQNMPAKSTKKRSVGGAVEAEATPERTELSPTQVTIDGLADVELEDMQPVAQSVEPSTELQLSLVPEQVISTETEAFDSIESLQRIVKVQATLDEMKGNLVNVIGAMNYNPSTLSKWANWYGSQSLIAKITTGAVVVAPPLIAGLAASIPGLVIAGAGGALAYSGAGILLDDHYQHSENNQLRLKEGVISLVALFDQVILSLEQLRHKLAVEIDRLASENDKLVANIQTLNSEVGTLTDKVSELSVQVQEQKASNEELKATTIKLQETEQKLAKRVKGAEATAIGMQNVLTTMIQNQSASAESQQAFEEKLQLFVNNKEATFERLADRVCKAEEELVTVNAKLEHSSAQYALLNQEHAGLVKRLETVMSHPAVQALELDSAKEAGHSAAKSMGRLGLHGCGSSARLALDEDIPQRTEMLATL